VYAPAGAPSSSHNFPKAMAHCGTLPAYFAITTFKLYPSKDAHSVSLRAPQNHPTTAEQLGYHPSESKKAIRKLQKQVLSCGFRVKSRLYLEQRVPDFRQALPHIILLQANLCAGRNNKVTLLKQSDRA
jgi:hypothetical protein